MTIREFKQDKLLLYSFMSAAVMLLIALAGAFYDLFKINKLLILHFDGYRGIDFLGNKSDVFGILGLSAAIILINLFLAMSVYYKERFLAYLLSFSSAIFSFLILAGVFVIISIN